MNYCIIVMITMMIVRKPTHIHSGTGGRDQHVLECQQDDGDAKDAAWESWEFGESIENGERAVDSLANLKLNECEPKGNAPESCIRHKRKRAVEILRPLISDARFEKMIRVLNARSGDARFVLENPSNPSNAWACLRTLESFGAQYVDVIASPEAYTKSGLAKATSMHTAMGAQKWLDVDTTHRSGANCVRALKDSGYSIFCTDLAEGAESIDSVDWASEGPFAIVFGNEAQGISPDVRALADRRIFVPMRGFAQSFSLSASCAAVASYLDAKGAFSKGSLPSWERERLLCRWSLDSVRGAVSVLRRGGF
eukprot:g4250.t1